MNKHKKHHLWETVRGRKHNYLDLLDAVAELGSIRAAASQLGMSYKSAWDAIQSLSELMKHPLVTRQIGGQRGGGVTLTAQGKRFLVLCRQLEQEEARLTDELAAAIDNFTNYQLFHNRYRLKSSARNQLHGQVTQLIHQGLKTQVSVRLATGLALQVSITRTSCNELQLAPGKSVCALIKAPWVNLQRSLPADHTCNCFPCCVKSVDTDSHRREVMLEMENGEPLVADLPAEFELTQGDNLFASFDPAQIILTTVEVVSA